MDNETLIRQRLQSCRSDEDFVFQIAYMVFQFLGELGSDDLVWEVTHDFFEVNDYSTERLQLIHEKVRDKILSYNTKS